MGRISTYPKDTYVTGLDKWIGSDANTENFATKNFTSNAVADYFNRSAIIDTGQFSWQFQPFSDTQPQAEMTFQQIDHLNQNINILGLAAAPLRVSALTMANTMPKVFIVNEWVGQAILVHVPSGPSQYAIYNVVSVVPDTDWFFIMELELVSGVAATIQQGDSLVFGYYNAANAVTEVKATFPILVEGTTEPTISLDVTTKNNWNTAYSRSLVSASVTGTTTKTLTLTEQGGSTITTSWVDDNTDAVTSVFGRTGAIVAQSGDYTTTLVTEGTNLYFTDQRARNVISSSITGIDYSNTTGIFSLTTGYLIPTTTEQGNWNTAYNDSITAAAVTGTTTKTLTLTQQDGGTITATWTDDNTDAVTSVFGRTGAVISQTGDYNTSQVNELTNLYFTDARARGAISLTTTGTSGAATYDSGTGILNIPQYQGGVTSFNTRTGAITLTSLDVTDALTFTPENVANKSNDTALGTSATLYPTQNAVKTYVDSVTAGGIILQGDWNAATNTPDITATTRTGFAWRVSVAGNTDLGGITDWLVGDLAVKSATGWIKIDNTDSVTSVFGRFGTVVAQTGDYTSDQVTEGTTNLYFTTARAIASPLTGYNPAAGVITASDSILTAINKLSGNTAAGYVPYTGATDNLNLGEFGLSTGYVQLDLTPSSPTPAVGKIVWDTTYGTPSVGLAGGNVNLQIGQEEVVLIHNGTGAALTDGQVVLITGSTGEFPSVGLASAASESLSAATLGVVTEPIANGANGFVTVSGVVHGLNTLAYNEGDLLWLSPTAGQFTSTKPISPNHLVLIGYVIKKAGGNGSIFVKIQNTQELAESSDVLISAPEVDGQGLFLQTVSGVQLWRNRTIGDVLGYTPANAATTITINNTTQDLSQNRTWSVGTVTSVGLTLGTTGTDANISNSPITTTGEITLNLPTASATNRGLLSSGDWTTFNSKQGTITLTTTGSSGASTLVGTTLNIPTYTLSGLGGQPLATNLTSLSALTFASTSFVKMTAAGTFALDTNTYLTTSSAASTYLPLTGGTLSGSLTATSLIKSGGTSAQILAADGSVLTAGTNITISGGTISASGGGGSSARNEQTFTATAGTNNLTVTGGYTVGLVDVYVNGVKYAPSDFTATTSPTVTITGLVANDVIDIITYNSTVGNIAGSGTTNYVPKFTATGTIGNSRIFDNGTNVGIGTASPTTNFQVVGANGVTDSYGQVFISTTDTATQNFGGQLTLGGYYNGTTNQTAFAAIAGRKENSTANNALGYLAFATQNGTITERMRITSVGTVFVGRTANWSLVGDSTGAAIYQTGAVYAVADSDNAALFSRKTNDGQILIFRKDTTTVGYISTNTYSLPSDLNFKKNINSLDLGLNLVTKLRPVSYNHKIDDDNSPLSTGFIAQELEQSLSDLGVPQNEYYILQNKENEDETQSNYWLDYTKLIPVLTKAIQELSAKVTALENK